MITIKLLIILSVACGSLAQQQQYQGRYRKLSASNNGYGYSQVTTETPQPPRQTLPTPQVNYGYSQQTTMPPPPPPRQTVPTPVFNNNYGYSQQTTMPPPPPPPRQTVPTPVFNNNYGYAQQTTMPPPPPPQRQAVTGYGYGQATNEMERPMAIPMDAPMQMQQNPCTEEVMRSSQALFFSDPSDRSSYLVCEGVNRFHRMPCASGTFFDQKMSQCIPEGFEQNACESLCKNDADCVVDEMNNARCSCKAGFTGQFCEVNIDECALGGNNACAGGQCVDQINGYYCECSGNRIGLNCQQTMEVPCVPSNLDMGLFIFELPSAQGNVWLQCVGEMTFVVHKCADNLFWNNELQTCTVERPVAKSGACRSLPCRNGAECQDLGNQNFQCLCRVGFTGESCESIVDLCLTNPCSNGGRCLSWIGGYTCVCQNKIIDETCTSGLNNPCPTRTNLIPGFNDYFPHPSSNRYFHCDIDGRAFARTCMTGLRWKQEALSCLPESFVLESPVPKAMAPISKVKPVFRSEQPIFQATTQASFVMPRRPSMGVPMLQQLPQMPQSSLSSQSSGYGAYAPVAEAEVPRPEISLVTPSPVVVEQTTESSGYANLVGDNTVVSGEEEVLESESGSVEQEQEVVVTAPEQERVPQDNINQQHLNKIQFSNQQLNTAQRSTGQQLNQQQQPQPMMNNQFQTQGQLNTIQRSTGQQLNQQPQQPMMNNQFQTQGQLNTMQRTTGQQLNTPNVQISNIQRSAQPIINQQTTFMTQQQLPVQGQLRSTGQQTQQPILTQQQFETMQRSAQQLMSQQQQPQPMMNNQFQQQGQLNTMQRSTGQQMNQQPNMLNQQQQFQQARGLQQQMPNKETNFISQPLRIRG